MDSRIHIKRPDGIVAADGDGMASSVENGVLRYDERLIEDDGAITREGDRSTGDQCGREADIVTNRYEAGSSRHDR